MAVRDVLTDQFAGKPVLVTGGLGFVGSNLVCALADQHGAKVTILDDLFTGRRSNLGSVADQETIVEGSVEDARLVSSLVAEADYIFHLAARNIIASTNDPLRDLQTNVGGTMNVLLAAQEARRAKSIVYTSTTSMYGNPRYLPINEDDQVRFLSPYSASKYSGEAYCQVFYELHGLPTVVVRYSNVYGPRQSPENPYSGVVAKFIERRLNCQPLSIHGDGEQTRDFTFIDDAVEATLAAGLSARAVGQIYNVASGRETTVTQLANLISNMIGDDAPNLDFIQRRDIDNVRRRVLNIERIRHDLNWIPGHTLEAGLRKTVEWQIRQSASEAA